MQTFYSQLYRMHFTFAVAPSALLILLLSHSLWLSFRTLYFCLGLMKRGNLYAHCTADKSQTIPGSSTWEHSDVLIP